MEISFKMYNSYNKYVSYLVGKPNDKIKDKLLFCFHQKYFHLKLLLNNQNKQDSVY